MIIVVVLDEGVIVSWILIFHNHEKTSLQDVGVLFMARISVHKSKYLTPSALILMFHLTLFSSSSHFVFSHNVTCPSVLKSCSI